MASDEQATKAEILVIVSGTAEADSSTYIQDLKNSGYEVVTCANPNNAINIMSGKPRSWIPKMFIVDVVIPKLSGFELVRRISENKLNKDIPIIMMSQYCSHEDGIEASNAGAVTVIPKPITIADLESAFEKTQLKKIKEDIAHAAFKIDYS